MILDCGHLETQMGAQIWSAMHGVSFPVLYDENAVVVPFFLPDYGGTFVLPHTCIIDDEQILRFSEMGYDTLTTMNEYIETIESLLSPELGANVEEIDFGNVNVGVSSNFEVYLDNVRTGIVDVTLATVSGAPYSVDFTAGEIYALDDELLVTVTFTPAEGGTVSDNLMIESSGGNLTIPLTGNGLLSVGDEPDQNFPCEFALEGNFPNPFNAETRINFTLPQEAKVILEVFGASGKLIKKLENGVYQAGSNSIVMNATDLNSGIYFYRLTAGNNSAVGKMIFLK